MFDSKFANDTTIASSVLFCQRRNVKDCEEAKCCLYIKEINDGLVLLNHKVGSKQKQAEHYFFQQF